MPYSLASMAVRFNAGLILLCALSISALSQTRIDTACKALLVRNATKPKAFFTKDTLSDHRIEWYEKHLFAMKEPSLLPRDKCAFETYRFLWLRTFDAPIAIRVWTSNGQHFLVAKQLSGQGGYEPGRIVINRIKTLSNEEWEELAKLLSGISFWDLPTEPPAVKNPDGTVTIGFDGAQWIVEGLCDAKYHVTDRWSATDKYRELCLYLLKLSSLRVRKKVIY